MPFVYPGDVDFHLITPARTVDPGFRYERASSEITVPCQQADPAVLRAAE
jgi:hypothetical protein